jgi:lysophospholipase L1-like esterase
MSFEYHEFIYILMLDECQRILEKLNKPYLHLFSFDPDIAGYKTYEWNKHLPNSETRCLAKISSHILTFNDEYYARRNDLPNHMNHAGNKLVSKMVLDKLKKLWNITQ